MIKIFYVNAVIGVGILPGKGAFGSQIVTESDRDVQHKIFCYRKILCCCVTGGVRCNRIIFVGVIGFGFRKQGGRFRQIPNQGKVSACVPNLPAYFSPGKTVIVFVQIMIARKVSKGGSLPRKLFRAVSGKETQCLHIKQIFGMGIAYDPPGMTHVVFAGRIAGIRNSSAKGKPRLLLFYGDDINDAAQRS